MIAFGNSDSGGREASYTSISYNMLYEHMFETKSCSFFKAFLSHSECIGESVLGPGSDTQILDHSKGSFLSFYECI